MGSKAKLKTYANPGRASQREKKPSRPREIRRTKEFEICIIYFSLTFPKCTVQISARLASTACTLRCPKIESAGFVNSLRSRRGISKLYQKISMAKGKT